MTTAFVVIGSPLFFIPTAQFSPEVTYYVVMIIAITIALCAYVIQALLTKSWHTISRFELIAYSGLVVSVLLSVAFARDAKAALFGYSVNPFVAASLIALPVVMYLVRTLPEQLRAKLKAILVAVLGAVTLLFISALIVQGGFANVVTKLFSGFASPLSFATYIGLFVLAIVVYVQKADIHIKHKAPVAFTGLIIAGVIISLGLQGDIRPSVGSSVHVAKEVLLNDGIFGIGAGEFSRAWQLYRPDVIIQSAAFGVDFSQGSGTVTTFLSTIGIVGTIFFLFLTLGSLFFSFIVYRTSHDKKEHFVRGVLALALLYFAIGAWVIPFSFAMLVVWMVIAGFGAAKMSLNEYHPSKKAAYVFIPIAALLVAHSYFTIQKMRAVSVYGQAQKLLTTSGPTDEAEKLFVQAGLIFPFDGFYRAQVEYAIARERDILSSTTNQEEVKEKYLEKAQFAVDAGLRAVKINPYNYQNYVSLGRAYELALPFDKEGGYDRAKKSYEEAIKLYPNNPYLYVTVARLEASAGTKEAVRTKLGEALKKKQNFTDALYLMSQLEASEEKIDEALTYAIEAVKSAPQDPTVYVQAGLLFYGKKDYQNAVTALQEALRLEPANGNTAYFLALSLRDGGRSDLAQEIGEELLKRNPGNANIEEFLASLKLESAESGVTKKETKK